MGILIQALQFFASLSLLVLIHEFGHFITARMFGMRVDKFYLFFNPWFSLYKRKIGNTEYGIGWVPLGGYVGIYDNREPLIEKEEKLKGELDKKKAELKSAKRKGESIEELEAEVERLKGEIEAVNEEFRTLPPSKDELRGKPAWQRLIVMVAGVVMNVILAIAIYSGMLYTWGENYYHNDDMVNGYIFNTEAEALGFRDGDRIVTIDNEPIGNINDVTTRLLIVDHDIDVVVLRGGEEVGFTLPMTELIALRDREGYLGFFGEYIPFEIKSVELDSAKEAGLMAGDKVVAINEEAVSDYYSAQPLIQAAVGTDATLTIVREGEMIDLIVPISDKGIGVTLPMVTPRQVKYGFWESIPAGIKRAGKEIKSYWDQLVMMFNPETKLYKEMGGFISIGSIFPSAWNWYAFWNVTALLSIILAVMNLLPIPVLDGGHVVFALWEMITRRKPNEKLLTVLQNIGFYLLMALIIYANGSDILRLFQ
ncbi:MAG: RIP metalloprotease RseP [Alistipes sp.]|nr:RIP metalloprotease RseP [Alistipes sp.]